MAVWCPPCSVLASLESGVKSFTDSSPCMCMAVHVENSLRIAPRLAFQNMVRARDASKWVPPPDFSSAAMAPHMWRLNFKCPSKVAA